MRKTENLLHSLVFSCSLLLTACQHVTSQPAAVTPPAYSQIRNAGDGSAMTPEQLLTALSNAPVVIVGEEHTQPQHHQIEQWLLQHLDRMRPQGSVLMEMLDITQQSAIDQVKQAMQSGAAISESRIPHALRWNIGWPWPLYRNVVQTALAGRYPLIAANISRQQVNALYAHPTFPAGERTSREEVHNALSAIIYLMHDGQIDSEQVTAMMAIQQHRDRFMAQQLMSAPRPALLIAGGYHATKDVGVPLHLQDLHGEKPVVVMLTTEGTALSAAQADYIWSVPAAK